ncbi:MAG: cohesin domain-containing protein [Chloroflexota bacterium]|nr:cohesin domain-containing protein [Chloroflexota bacterium]
MYFENVGDQSIGTPFTIRVEILNVSYLAYAAFDLRFDDTILQYQSTASSSTIGAGSGTVNALQDPGNLGDNGLLRIDIDYTSYAGANEGNGVSGSGYLCEITFNAINTGTSQLNFVSGQGEPEGELTLVEWEA